MGRPPRTLHLAHEPRYHPGLFLPHQFSCNAPSWQHTEFGTASAPGGGGSNNHISKGCGAISVSGLLCRFSELYLRQQRLLSNNYYEKHPLSRPHQAHHPKCFYISGCTLGTNLLHLYSHICGQRRIPRDWLHTAIMFCNHLHKEMA